MIKTVLLASIFFLLGLGSVFGFRYFQARQAEKKNIFTPQQLTFKSEHHSQALTGTLTDLSGKVTKQPREGDKRDAEKNEPMLTGESLFTENGKAFIEFPRYFALGMEKNTQISLITLLPKVFLLRQTDGTVHYKNLSTDPITVRSLRMLLEIDAGESTITTNTARARVTVDIQSGKGKIAYVDLEDTTHIIEITEGQTAVYDEATRTIDLRK